MHGVGMIGTTILGAHTVRDTVGWHSLVVGGTCVGAHTADTRLSTALIGVGVVVATSAGAIVAVAVVAALVVAALVVV